MGNRRSNKVSKQYITIGEQTYEEDVYYSLGGMNCYTYKQEPRGFYCSVTPVKVKKYDGYESVEYMAFSGTKSFLLEAKRFSESGAKKAIALFDEEIKSRLYADVNAKLDLRANGDVLFKATGYSIPPKYHGLSVDQIMQMPVFTVAMGHSEMFPSLAACGERLKGLCGPMADTRDGVPVLRFETKEAYEILSD